MRSPAAPAPLSCALWASLGSRAALHQPGHRWELCGYPLAERKHERASPRTAGRVSNRRARALGLCSNQEVICSFFLSFFVFSSVRDEADFFWRRAGGTSGFLLGNQQSRKCSVLAFSSSATFQVQQQKTVRKIYAPICQRLVVRQSHLFKIVSSFSGTVAIAGSSGRAREAAQKRQFFPLARPTLRSL